MNTMSQPLWVARRKKITNLADSLTVDTRNLISSTDYMRDQYRGYYNSYIQHMSKNSEINNVLARMSLAIFIILVSLKEEIKIFRKNDQKLLYDQLRNVKKMKNLTNELINLSTVDLPKIETKLKVQNQLDILKKHFIDFSEFLVLDTVKSKYLFTLFSIKTEAYNLISYLEQLKRNALRLCRK